jgi:hypothetical protein
VAALNQQLLGNLFVRHDDEGLVQGSGVVDGAVFVGPLFELEPEREPWQVMNAAHDGELLWAWKPGLGSDALSPCEDLLDGREDEARDGQVEEDQGESLHLGRIHGGSPAEEVTWGLWWSGAR